MSFIYNIALALGFVILSPRFLYDAITKGKYAAGFKQRLGLVPDFDAAGRHVVLLHCVSVGEVNAALPLARRLKDTFQDVALVVSTTTKTGQQVANEAYKDVADLIVYFPFDFKFAVKRFLKRIQPGVVLLTETELWFNFVRLSYKSNARVVVVNGRLSERSFKRYTWIKGFMKRLLGYVDLALMQTNADATRLMALGIRGSKVKVIGNLKFDHDLAVKENALTREFRERFGISPERPLILAASTHDPEERYVLEALESEPHLCRLMLVPRHPERFDSVERLLIKSSYTFVKRTSPRSDADRSADVILLDTVGELRFAYPLAEIVFVGGSLIPHGGQSVFEPAAVGKAIVTGPYTENFSAVVDELLRTKALRQTPIATDESQISERLREEFTDLLSNEAKRTELGRNAAAAMLDNRGAVDKTLKYIEPLIKGRG
ncbi:MAG TPA: 3-deoxy-D-manno-octulosonic acid transferase [Pyrinomonadaceae bacterium]|jgi:3-deoxy-D-manno-octulosonic-acid transferase|nr:3-deoxy-D-manno-octulosonic acid transferase [Pyrinomonadaceae bacterium]